MESDGEMHKFSGLKPLKIDKSGLRDTVKSSNSNLPR